MLYGGGVASYRSLSKAALAVHSAFSASPSSLHLAAMPFITSVTLQNIAYVRGAMSLEYVQRMN